MVSAPFSFFVFSNKLEQLAKALSVGLFHSEANPFTQRFIVVPSPAIKSWLTQFLAKEKGIAAGFECCFLQEAIQRLSKELHPFTDIIPSNMELRLKLELVLYQKIFTYDTMLPDRQRVWKPLFEYLQLTPNSYTKDSLTSKVRKRLFGLTKQLSSLFHTYGIYGGNLVSKWEKLESCQDWQQELWKEIYAKDKYNWSYPDRILRNWNIAGLTTHRPMELHLFGLSFLPQSYLQFFNKLSTLMPVCGYLLSPSAYFWTDIKSDKERVFLQKKWQQSQVNEPTQAQMEEYLSNRNPLLANLGKLGKNFFKAVLEDHNTEIIENYQLPFLINPDNSSIYDDLITENVQIEASLHNDLTLLKGLQADFLLMRNPEQGTVLQIRADDQTIQVHQAPSRLREVQILYQNILALLDQSNRTNAHAITPGDIVVMAPQIMDYEPYIRAVFDTAEHEVDYQIVDLQMHRYNPFVSGLLSLLKLAESRWDVNSIFQLIDHVAFQSRFNLNKEQVEQLRVWVNAAGIKWGNDHEHCNELLRKAHCDNPMIEESCISTWEHGLKRLLISLCMEVSPSHVCDMSIDPLLYPLDPIELTKAPLLGQFIKVLRSLRYDLQPLKDYTKRSLREWSDYLCCLVEAYFAVDCKDHTMREQKETLLQMLDKIGFAGRWFQEEKFDFLSIKQQLDALFAEKQIGWQENRLQAIKFSSMFPMRAIPAKVVCLLGMDEEQYPRKDQRLSLDLMQQMSSIKCHYQPSQVDNDRYVFLEAILSARSHLIISYLGQSQTDHKELSPSIVVTELLDYLDRSFHVAGVSPSHHCFFKHPAFPFDKSYFDPNQKKLNSYSKTEYCHSLASLKGNKEESFQFLPLYTASHPLSEFPSVELPQKRIQLDLQKLTTIASDPLRLYCNQTLGIFFRKKSHRLLQIEEPLCISMLDFTILKRDALKLGADNVLKKAQKEGRLPSGALRKVVCEHIKEEVKVLENNFKLMGLHSHDTFTIELNPYCQTPSQIDNKRWMVPAPIINLTTHTEIQIIGSIADIHTQGLITYSNESPETYFKIWITYLVLQTIQTEKLPIQKIQLLFAQDAKAIEWPTIDLEKAMKDYLVYYFQALQFPAPILPEWILAITQKDSSKLKKLIQQSLKEGWNSTYSEYLLWAFRCGSFPEAERIIQLWSPYVTSTYEKLIALIKD
ncbi:MAG: recC [Chlamydiales bacterium]|jgi:exodeoxyribonuclease V gamma subunit|nr:recC [Chlamydiales bacterium]